MRSPTQLTICLASKLFWLLLAYLIELSYAREVIWAINAGGSFHIDEHGIQYSEDPLHIGVASDFGKTLTIGRVSRKDSILYQTERYHTNSFSYDVQILQDGDYVLVMKFCEVYFTSPRQKIFNVVLNEQHLVVMNLDIFDKVGMGRAHDEIIPFKISNGKLVVVNEASTFDNVLKITFVKTHFDNPKINAMYIMRGTVDDVPKLPPLLADVPGSFPERDPSNDPLDKKDSPPRSDFNRRSGPVPQNPYLEQPGNYAWPIFFAIVAFIPIVVCLCKM